MLVLFVSFSSLINWTLNGCSSETVRSRLKSYGTAIHWSLVHVLEISSRNLWLLPRLISDALIQYIVKPETQGLSLYNSYTYVNNCKTPFPSNIA